MVSVRNAHLNSDKALDLPFWINGLSLQSTNLQNKLLMAGKYCEEKCDPLLYLKRLRSGIEMVEILHSLNMDDDSLCAALLYPFVQHQLLTINEIEVQFGQSVANLIHGVEIMQGIRQLKAAKSDSITSEQMNNVRQMLLAMVEDFRCVVIKLAERITFLRGIGESNEEERVLAANECANIYAPLANRLGIGQLKWELEDFSFRYQHPDKYREIANLLDEKRLARTKYVNDFVADLQKLMLKEGIKAKIYGRPKHIYSIWRKLQKKHISFSELYDVRAIRIIVDRLQDCYAALGVVHTQFYHLPKEFDDYIANPKPNGYQSIHTVVLGPQGKTIEIQIRTQQMHDEAELGVAAHWKYKEGGGKASADDRIAWLNKLLTWEKEIADNGEILQEVRSQVFDDHVYVFTPKGDVIDMPAGATVLDFAYHIHSDVGNRCCGAKVGGRIVPFVYQLQMGDQVEILTQKHPNPSRDWLNPHLGFVNTHRARSKIQTWFKKQDREKNLITGKEIIEESLGNDTLQQLKEIEKTLIERYKVSTLDDIFVGVGGGDIRVNQFVNFVKNTLNSPSQEEKDQALLAEFAKRSDNNKNHPTQHKGRIIVEGVGNLMHYIARCCHPIPSDEIVGFISQGRGIAIHRVDCEQLLELKAHLPERIVEASWSENDASGYSVLIRVEGNDRNGLLRDVTTIMFNEKVKLKNVRSSINAKEQIVRIDMEVEVFNQQVFDRVLIKLNQLSDVIEAKRVAN